MGGTFSRNKGKRGEREIVQLLQPVLNHVYEKLRYHYPQHAEHLETPVMRRNQMQSDGGGYDLVGVDWMAAEVKNREKQDLVAAWKQCCTQARKGQEPVLFYKRNGAAWRVRLWASRYLDDGTWWYAPADVSAVDFLNYFQQRSQVEALRAVVRTTTH